MAIKTFKIGECAQGGIITVEINNEKIDIIGKEWDHSQGTRKSSNQTNAKEFTRKSFTTSNHEYDLEDFLCELTTSYYAGKVLDWIKTKVEFKNYSRW